MDKELFCMVPSDRNGAGRQFLVGRVRYWASLGIAQHEVVTHLRGAVLSAGYDTHCPIGNGQGP